MRRTTRLLAFALGLGTLLGLSARPAAAAEDWVQLKFDARHSGDAPQRALDVPLGLVAAVPLTDAVFTAPVVAGGRVFVVDGSGVAFCLDAQTGELIWKLATAGGPLNCNNVSSPAICQGYLHFGTTAGSYYVVDCNDGRVVRRIDCGEPIFSAPVVGPERVYFATLGARVYAVQPDGQVCWTWDYVRQRLGFTGDRFSGADWLEHKGGRATWRDQFCCSRDIALWQRTLVIPAGGETVWLEDTGEGPQLRGVGLVPPYAGSELPATFGLSIGADGTAYRQWHRRDNTGRVETLRLKDDGTFETGAVAGTLTRNDMPGLLSFSSVSLRAKDVFRCRPEQGFGLCLHRPEAEEPQVLCPAASLAAPIVLRDQVVYGGLDGRLYVVSLSGADKLAGTGGASSTSELSGAGPRVWSFATAFGRAITAPACVCDGRVYFGCDDGYLYILGPEGRAPLPKRDLELWRIRTPLAGAKAGPEYDWFTNFGNFRNTNANDQGLRPPLRIQWIRRYQGTFKHLPVCGGGRMYTHTAEGQVFAVEQATGRLLWRWYAPGVHLSFTSPLYWNGRLLVPQAGLKRSLMRCFDAATGRLLWEAPFSGSPSWSRQQPPVVWRNLAIYQFSTGRYVPRGTGIYVMRQNKADPLPETTEGEVSWLYSHDNPFYPPAQRPLVRAWDMDTGREVWTADFSEYGSGGDDAGLCLMDDKLYYSCFFGYAARRRGQPGPTGITAAMDPATGRVLWANTEYSVTAGCTLSAEAGRLYLGGYNPPNTQTDDRYVWCLDARDGSLVWQSEPITKAINVVTVGEDFLFAFAYGGNACLLDKQSGRVRLRFNHGYACTRFSYSRPYLLGTNADLVDLSQEAKVVWSGPCVDGRECVGGVVSNGRVFYTAQASGLQLSLVGREE